MQVEKIKEAQIKITKGFMPWYCFIIPTFDTKNIKHWNRIYWLGFVFHRNGKKETCNARN